MEENDGQQVSLAIAQWSDADRKVLARMAVEAN